MRTLLGVAVLLSVASSFLSARGVRFEDVPPVPYQPSGPAFGTIWGAIYFFLVCVGVENTAFGNEEGGEGTLSLSLLVSSLLLTVGWAVCAERTWYRVAFLPLLLSCLLAWASLATRTSLSFPSSSPWSDAGVGLLAGWLSAATLLSSFLAFPNLLPYEGRQTARREYLLLPLLVAGGVVAGSALLGEPWPCAALAWGAFWQE